MASVWRNTTLIVLCAQIAAIYAAILIPFKVGIPIIPGFVELRPANAIPLVSSLLFGPATAWGAELAISLAIALEHSVRPVSLGSLVTFGGLVSICHEVLSLI